MNTAVDANTNENGKSKEIGKVPVNGIPVHDSEQESHAGNEGQKAEKRAANWARPNQQQDNLADELFLLIEETSGGFNTGEMSAAAALLLDEELKQFFQDDEFVWPELKTIWTSDPLPRDLVITIGPKWTNKLKNEFYQVLLNMKNNQPGLDILGIMQSSGFAEINSDLLTKTIERYFSIKN